MLTRWNPFQDLQEMDRLFDDVFNAPQPLGGNGQTATMPTFSLPLDVQETENAYRVQATVAGFTPEQVEVSFSDGLLTINAKSERAGEVNASDIKASVENGVLTIEVPKAAPSKPIKIEVLELASTGLAQFLG